jgi:uncharacterized protein YpmS
MENLEDPFIGGTMRKSVVFTLLFVISLALSTLACKVFVGGPEYPPTAVPVSTEAAANLEQQVEAAKTAAAQNGLMTLTVTESQVTSLLNEKLAANPDLAIHDPQVLLRDNQIQVFGKASQGGFEVNVRIVLAASIDAEGKPVLTVTSADFGPLPAPEGLNKTVSAMLDEAFTGALGPAASGLRLESITIANGVMTLTGRVK